MTIDWKNIGTEVSEAVAPQIFAIKGQAIQAAAADYGVDPDALEDWLDEHAEENDLTW